ncbi:MAG TPA: hypothetical protein VFL81_01210 [Candidatus Saccharimonadales bacterium]|nr:hypothetical protein [Candidatus Saccharimonadales bacterium]
MGENLRQPQIYAVLHNTDRIFLPDGTLPHCQAQSGSAWEQQIAAHIQHNFRLGVSIQASLGFRDDDAGYLMRLSHGVSLPPDSPDWLHSGQAVELLADSWDLAAAHFAKTALETFSASRRLDTIG